MLLWSEYSDSYLNWLGLHGGGRHLDKATEVLSRFDRYMTPGGLESITQAMYIKYLARRREDPGRGGKLLTASTLNGDIRILNPAFACALAPTDAEPERLGLAPDGWRAPKIKILKEPKNRPRTLSQDQMSRLFMSCEHAVCPIIRGVTPPQWWRCFLLIAYVTGVRRTALLEIPRPTDQDLADRILRVPSEEDKVNTERAFALNDQAVAAIRALPVFEDGTLFGWPHGERWFYNVIHDFQDTAGIPRSEHGLPHDLRRTKATELIRMKCSLPIVQREMGHSTPSVTARCYIGNVTEEQRDAINLLPIPQMSRERQLQLDLS